MLSIDFHLMQEGFITAPSLAAAMAWRCINNSFEISL
jgi:hypothetical protein